MTKICQQILKNHIYKKAITFQINLIKKYWYSKKILKNKILDLDKYFYLLIK